MLFELHLFSTYTKTKSFCFLPDWVWKIQLVHFLICSNIWLQGQKNNSMKKEKEKHTHKHKKIQMCHTLNHDFLRNSSNNIVFFFVIPRVLAKNGGHLEFSEVFAIFYNMQNQILNRPFCVNFKFLVQTIKSLGRQ